MLTVHSSIIFKLVERLNDFSSGVNTSVFGV